MAVQGSGRSQLLRILRFNHSVTKFLGTTGGSGSCWGFVPHLVRRAGSELFGGKRSSELFLEEKEARSFLGKNGARSFFGGKRGSELFWGGKGGGCFFGGKKELGAFFGEKGAAVRLHGPVPCPGDTGGTRSGDIATCSPPGHAPSTDSPPIKH